MGDDTDQKPSIPFLKNRIEVLEDQSGPFCHCKASHFFRNHERGNWLLLDRVMHKDPEVPPIQGWCRLDDAKEMTLEYWANTGPRMPLNEFVVPV